MSRKVLRPRRPSTEGCYGFAARCAERLCLSGGAQPLVQEAMPPPLRAQLIKAGALMARLLIRNLFFTILQPGTAAVLIPWLLLRGPASRPFRTIGQLRIFWVCYSRSSGLRS